MSHSSCFHVVKEMSYLITCVKRGPKREKKANTQRRQNCRRCILSGQGSWYFRNDLSSLANPEWHCGWKASGMLSREKLPKMSCSTETFLKHVDNENLVFLLFRAVRQLPGSPSASASGATDFSLCLQKKLVLTCTTEINNSQSIGVDSGKARATLSLVACFIVAAVGTLIVSTDAQQPAHVPNLSSLLH